MLTLYIINQASATEFVVVRLEADRANTSAEPIHRGSLPSCSKVAAQLNKLQGKLETLDEPKPRPARRDRNFEPKPSVVWEASSGQYIPMVDAEQIVVQREEQLNLQRAKRTEVR